MIVKFWPSKSKRVLRSRRGKKIYREVEIKPNTRSQTYTGLPGSILELVEDGLVVGEKEISFSVPKQVNLEAVASVPEVEEPDAPKPVLEEKVREKPMKWVHYDKPEKEESVEDEPETEDDADPDDGSEEDLDYDV